MFEAIELGRTLSKEEYQRAVPELRVQLVNAQFELKSAKFPLIVLLSGDDRVAYGDVANVLHEWMDARYIETHAPGAETQEELEQPALWRHWRTLPRHGRTAMYVGDWTSEAVWARFRRRIRRRTFERSLERVARFEKALVDDGALVLKFWFHLSQRDHEARLDKKGESNWQVSKADLRLAADYESWVKLAEQALLATSTSEAPWHVIDSGDRRFRSVEAARRILEALASRLAEPPKPEPAVTALDASSVKLTERTGDAYTLLDRVDLSQTLQDDAYEPRLLELQKRLNATSLAAVVQGVPSVIVFEGWDAAGKGGCIRRMTSVMDARYYQVFPIAAPSEEERAHHYLWRFWTRLPRPGHMAIFDRSWYGRVLVERVEGFAAEHEWRRAYAEINEFEQQLIEHGVVLVKFWLHVDREEQLARFEAREKTEFKKYKITAEDYRNRTNWFDYERAVSDMVARTSTPTCPWLLVPSKDKRVARVEVLAHVLRALEPRVTARGS